MSVVISGSACALEPAREQSFSGGILRLAHVRVDDHVAYLQGERHHLLHATLRADAAPSAGRIGRREWVRRSSRTGGVSFTPGDWERCGFVGAGEIVGLEIGLEPWFLETACEQTLPEPERGVFNGADTKSFALAGAIAGQLARPRADPLILDTLLLALARHVGRLYAGAERRRDDAWLHPGALARIVEQMRDQPAQDLRLNDLARLAGLGVSAFVRAFRGSTGMTPARFAARLRLDCASEALRGTDLPVAEIAALHGFASASHFISAFRSHFRTTPGHWRRSAG